jgi:hypothetical protein
MRHDNVPDCCAVLNPTPPRLRKRMLCGASQAGPCCGGALARGHHQSTRVQRSGCRGSRRFFRARVRDSRSTTSRINNQRRLPFGLVYRETSVRRAAAAAAVPGASVQLHVSGQSIAPCALSSTHPPITVRPHTISRVGSRAAGPPPSHDRLYGGPQTLENDDDARSTRSLFSPLREEDVPGYVPALRFRFGKPPPRKQTQGTKADPILAAEARLVLEGSAGWESPYSRGLCGGDALVPFTQTDSSMLIFRQVRGSEPARPSGVRSTS